MVFVYQGAGKKQSKDADICSKNCIRFNGDIQWCLAKNNYQQKKCTHAVDAWVKCCAGARAQERGTDLETERALLMEQRNLYKPKAAPGRVEVEGGDAAAPSVTRPVASE
ncbi:hypothetical protein FOA52_008515 [Chlamydomonas sp. UWO 241]|nr:hypothetical protein FOA52_008515 [Chlamydomonas sp. UWO 241]